MTPAQLRKIALALPGAEEGAHMGHADFRIGGKIFAGLTGDETKASLKLEPEVQSAVLADDSGAFEAAAGAWGRAGWTYILLAKAPAAMVKSLLAESHALVAANAKKPAKKKKAAAKATARGARRSPRRP